MNCPLCGTELRVIDSRRYMGTVRRRRDCEKCKYRTTTYEISQEEMLVFRKLEREKEDIMHTVKGIVKRYGMNEGGNEQ